MKKMKDWILQHKTIYTKKLPNGFSIYVSINIHESGKITVNLNCSVVIGSFPQGLRSGLGNISNTLKNMSNSIRTEKRV